MNMLEELIDYLDDTAGPSLRAVGYYREDEFDLLYHRSDLDYDDLHDRLGSIHEAITWDWRPPDDCDIDTLGREFASVQIREHAVIVHLTAGEQYGVLIGLEPEAASDLNAFVLECLEHADGISPPAYDS